MYTFIKAFALMLSIIMLSGGLLLAQEDFSSANSEKSYSLSARSDEINENYELTLNLKTNIQTPISLYQSDLPWVSRYSMIIVICTLNMSASHLEAAPPPIEDPSTTIVTIKPGEIMSGKISLSHRFPGLNKAVRASDVIVFWSYQLKQTNNKSLDRLGGWIVIPKSGKVGRHNG